MISKSSASWQDKFDRLQVKFEDKVNDFAERLADGDLSEAEWRRAMESLIRGNYEQAWQMGASVADGTRAILTDEERALVSREVSGEMNFLRGFYNDLRTGARSEDYIINRATQYGNAIRGLYYGGLLGRTNDYDWEAWFICNEDERSCDGCITAADQSPWPPSQCPVPGSGTCDGFEMCRCDIEFRPRDTSYVTEQIAQQFSEMDLAARPTITKRIHGGVLIAPHHIHRGNHLHE